MPLRAISGALRRCGASRNLRIKLRHRESLLLCATAAVFGPLALPVRADTTSTWDGSANNWSGAVHWSTNPYYPNNGNPAGSLYSVSINSGTVTLDVNPTIDSLLVGNVGELTTNAATTLTLSAMTNLGQFIVTDSFFKDTGTATNSGDLYFTAGSTATFAGVFTNSNYFSTGYSAGNDLITVGGTFNNLDNLTLNSVGDTVNVNALNNEGMIVLERGTAINITGGGQGITDIPSGTEIDVYGGGINVINNGVGTSAFANLATIEGRLYLISGESYKDPSLTVSDFLNVGAGSTLTLSGNLTNTGQVQLGFSGEGNDLLTVAGTLNNTGNFTLQYSGDVVNAHTLSNIGLISLGSGTTFNITGGGQGITDIPAGAEIDVYGGAFNVINNGVGTSAFANLATIEGRLYFISGESYKDSSLTVSNFLDVGAGSTLTLSGNLTNTGQIQTGYSGEGNDVLTVNGSLNNTGGIYLQYSGDVVNAHTLNNVGLISLQPGTTLNITGGGQGFTDIPSSAQIDDYGGNFNVINNNVGTSALAKLATVEGRLYLISGETYNFGPLTNSGYINVGAGTTATVTGNLGNSGQLVTGYNSGNDTLTVTGTLTNSDYVDLQLPGDTLNVGVLNNQGLLSIGNGTTMNITGGGSGITDVPLGSEIDLYNGSFNVINNSVGTGALVHLSTVEGGLYLLSGQSYTFGPVTDSHLITVGNGTTATFSSSLINNGSFNLGYSAGNDFVNVMGTLTNSNQFALNSAGDVASVNILNNTGGVTVNANTLLTVGPGSLAASGGIALHTGIYVSGVSTTTQGVFTSSSGTVSISGPLTVANNGRVNDNGGAFVASSLSITGNGAVNLNATLDINYGTPASDPISSIVTLLAAGYHGGAWSGTSGFLSTMVQSGSGTPLLSIGYSDGNIDTGQGNSTATSAQPNQVEIKFTLAGDSNLDGSVDFTDLFAVGKYLNTTGNDWAQGNFNFAANGAVDFSDLFIIGQNLNKNLGSLATGIGGTTIALGDSAAVTEPMQSPPVQTDIVRLPEPGALTLLAVGAMGMLGRRRRRAKG